MRIQHLEVFHGRCGQCRYFGNVIGRCLGVAPSRKILATVVVVVVGHAVGQNGDILPCSIRALVAVVVAVVAAAVIFSIFERSLVP